MNKERLLDYCYHSHTFRCGHAHGLDDDFVKAAKSVGVKHLGFSDHVMLPGFAQTGIRGKYLFIDDYIFSVNTLKKKYEGDVEIKLAFECEWYGGRFKEYYKDLLTNRGFDYLILGEHCYLDENDRFQWYGLGENKSQVLAYADSLVEAMKSGLFLYVAHADLFMIWYHEFDEFAEEACRRIAEASVKYDVPLEINMGSLRRDVSEAGQEDNDAGYPKVACWKIFAKYGVNCVIGYDSHCPEDYPDSLPRVLPYCYKLVDELGLHLLTNDELWAKRKKIC